MLVKLVDRPGLDPVFGKWNSPTSIFTSLLITDISLYPFQRNMTTLQFSFVSTHTDTITTRIQFRHGKKVVPHGPFFGPWYDLRSSPYRQYGGSTSARHNTALSLLNLRFISFLHSFHAKEAQKNKIRWNCFLKAANATVNKGQDKGHWKSFSEGCLQFKFKFSPQKCSQWNGSVLSVVPMTSHYPSHRWFHERGCASVVGLTFAIK